MQRKDTNVDNRKRTPTVLRKRTNQNLHILTSPPANADGQDNEITSPTRPQTANILHNRNTSYQHNSLYQDAESSAHAAIASPQRPLTAGPATDPRRWSSLPRPTGSHRPQTSKSGNLGNVDEHGMVARPKTSLGGPEYTLRGRDRQGEKKRWSVKRLFHRET